VIRIKKSHLAINEQVADDGVIFLGHFSKVSINDLFSLSGNWGKGDDMNLIAYLAPTHVHHSYMCPAGLGGYSNEGFAWRYSM
jgi:hypothetical protein